MARVRAFTSNGCARAVGVRADGGMPGCLAGNEDDVPDSSHRNAKLAGVIVIRRIRLIDKPRIRIGRVRLSTDKPSFRLGHVRAGAAGGTPLCDERDGEKAKWERA